jgi:hypothetical protein
MTGWVDYTVKGKSGMTLRIGLGLAIAVLAVGLIAGLVLYRRSHADRWAGGLGDDPFRLLPTGRLREVAELSRVTATSVVNGVRPAALPGSPARS